MEADTEPGLGLMAVKLENARLRQERDDLRALMEVPDSLPPPTPRQRRTRTKMAVLAGGSVGLGAALYPVFALLLRLAAQKWPDLQPIVDFLLPVLSP